jgi:hypothetical protein
MGIEVTCDECNKTTDDVICSRCAEKMAPLPDIDEFALHDLARAIARGARDDAFAALDVLIRDHPQAASARERIQIARAAA